jgi:DNA helicase-2/ATP-dependent DNA helicase PcrA
MKASTQGLFGGGYAGGGSGLFEEEANGMRMGQRVLHGKYGEGVVLQFEGNGERAKVQVNFAEGAKWLMVGYANLQVME